jgi:hypothetical protein
MAAKQRSLRPQGQRPPWIVGRQWQACIKGLHEGMAHLASMARASDFGAEGDLHYVRRREHTAPRIQGEGWGIGDGRQVV